MSNPHSLRKYPPPYGGGSGRGGKTPITTPSRKSLCKNHVGPTFQAAAGLPPGVLRLMK